jgi:hypothetical protein
MVCGLWARNSDKNFQGVKFFFSILLSNVSTGLFLCSACKILCCLHFIRLVYNRLFLVNLLRQPIKVRSRYSAYITKTVSINFYRTSFWERFLWKWSGIRPVNLLRITSSEKRERRKWSMSSASLNRNSNIIYRASYRRQKLFSFAISAHFS